jgi:hypothetical protein
VPNGARVQAVVVAATKGSLYVLRLTAESMRRDHEPPREQVRDLRPEILTHSMQAERSIPAAVPAPVSTFTSSVWSTDLASASPGVALAKRHTLTLEFVVRAALDEHRVAPALHRTHRREAATQQPELCEPSTTHRRRRGSSRALTDPPSACRRPRDNRAFIPVSSPPNGSRRPPPTLSLRRRVGDLR